MNQSSPPEAQQTPPADRYAVIGNPIAHSKSPAIHALFAAQTGQHLQYDAWLAPLDGFAAAVQDLIAAGVRGANVTLPFKLDAWALAHQLSERAQAAGAVNTLKFEDGVIFGDNTDGVGLVNDIVAGAGVALRGRRVLLLGAGGAARGALLPLLQQQPAEIVIANRTCAKARQLADEFAKLAADGGQGSRPCTLLAAELSALGGRFDVIINATSASLAADMPPVAASLFDARTLAYDMMYGAQPTRFMAFAAQQGAQVRDGLGMLVEQAAEAFFLWRGVRPDTAPVFAALRAQLQA
jgi:shikimate dehydrogenase